MDILFIGGTGNISSACAALLAERGHDVSVVTRGQRPIPPACKAIQANRYEAGSMENALRDRTFDTVINFLGFHISDIELDLNIFAGKIAQYIFISSATVYEKPVRSLPITETTVQDNPFSAYARNKQDCEELLIQTHADSNFPVTIVRPSHTYSHQWIPNVVASGDYTVVQRMKKSRPVFIPDDGQSLWTLTHSADFAVGLAGLVGLDEAVGEAFHITGDQVLTWNQIYAEVASAFDIESPNLVHIPTDEICEAATSLTPKLKGDKSEHAVFDNAKIKRFVPDFDCRTTFRQGIRMSAQWYHDHPEACVRDTATDAVHDKVIAAWADKTGRNF